MCHSLAPPARHCIDCGRPAAIADADPDVLYPLCAACYDAADWDDVADVALADAQDDDSWNGYR